MEVHCKFEGLEYIVFLNVQCYMLFAICCILVNLLFAILVLLLVLFLVGDATLIIQPDYGKTGGTTSWEELSWEPP